MCIYIYIQQANWPSPRTCPLCRAGPGTPRHVVMACAAMTPAVDLLRDDMEAELAGLDSTPTLLAAAQVWRHRLLARRPALVLRPCTEADSQRWPILSAWRWLIALPGREHTLSVDVAGSSAVPTSRECGSDVAYRGVLRPMRHASPAAGHVEVPPSPLMLLGPSRVAGATRMATSPASPATTPSTTADSATGTAERTWPMRQTQTPSAPIAGCTGLAALRLALGAEQFLWIKACSRTFCGQPSSARSAQDSMLRWHRRCA